MWPRREERRSRIVQALEENQGELIFVALMTGSKQNTRITYHPPNRVSEEVSYRKDCAIFQPANYAFRNPFPQDL